MQENQPTHLPVLQKDAKIRIEIGTGFYQRLQQIIAFIISDKTDEDKKALGEAIKEQKDPGDWMSHFMTISSLLKAVESAAREQGFVKDVPVEEFTKNIPKETAENENNS